MEYAVLAKRMSVMIDAYSKYARSKAAKPADGWAVFNTDRFKRYGLLMAQKAAARLDDLINYLEDGESEDKAQDTRSSRARGKQKKATKQRSAR